MYLQCPNEETIPGPLACKASALPTELFGLVSAVCGTRTRVTDVRGQRPSPLDEHGL